MNARRVAIWVGLVGLVSTLLFVPFKFYGSIGIAEPRPVSGTTYRAIWDSPVPNTIEFLPVEGVGSNEIVFVREADIDSAQLGLWWFGIALSVGAVLLLTRERRESAPATGEMKKCPECAEMVRLEAAKCRYCGHQFDVSAAQ